jgi:hypothetical protein
VSDTCFHCSVLGQHPSFFMGQHPSFFTHILLMWLLFAITFKIFLCLCSLHSKLKDLQVWSPAGIIYTCKSHACKNWKTDNTNACKIWVSKVLFILHYGLNGMNSGKAWHLLTVYMVKLDVMKGHYFISQLVLVTFHWLGYVTHTYDCTPASFQAA